MHRKCDMHSRQLIRDAQFEITRRSELSNLHWYHGEHLLICIPVGIMSAGNLAQIAGCCVLAASKLNDEHAYNSAAIQNRWRVPLVTSPQFPAFLWRTADL